MRLIPLSSVLKAECYRTAFFSSADLDFQNMRGFPQGRDLDVIEDYRALTQPGSIAAAGTAEAACVAGSRRPQPATLSGASREMPVTARVRAFIAGDEAGGGGFVPPPPGSQEASPNSASLAASVTGCGRRGPARSGRTGLQGYTARWWSRRP